jgi:hypothetical protein
MAVRRNLQGVALILLPACPRPPRPASPSTHRTASYAHVLPRSAIGHLAATNTPHATSMPPLVQAALDANSLVLFLAALGGCAWLALDRPGYCHRRTPFAAVNRAARSLAMLTIFSQARGAADEGGARRGRSGWGCRASG